MRCALHRELSLTHTPPKLHAEGVIRDVCDFVAWLRVQALVVNTGLDEIAKYADAIGPWKETLAPGSGTHLPIKFTTNLVDRFQAIQGVLHDYTCAETALPCLQSLLILKVLPASAGRTLVACRCTRTRSAMSP